MSIFDHLVIIRVPVALSETASSVGRAMDSDIGGADSFLARDGHLVAQTWAAESFAAMFTYLLANPDGLFMAVAADYENRWPGLTPPTLQEIKDFCASAEMTIRRYEADGMPI